ncbi:hypothetical protein ES332_D10G283600v1 [Gossypium tomentosum]|uniref:Uncharacterized protein n=1 Tax=Gossypium tomentosum TaxID=34277 RepID=A0A5D2J9M2_GOSTO|nr:hypothetical protein ES332_D10G283600v1 [Gossypium tomentosum]
MHYIRTFYNLKIKTLFQFVNRLKSVPKATPTSADFRHLQPRDDPLSNSDFNRAERGLTAQKTKVRVWRCASAHIRRLCVKRQARVGGAYMCAGVDG